MNRTYRVFGLILAISWCGVAWGFEKNQPRVLAAFRPLVEQVSLSTVRIYADGKRAALGTVVDADGYIFTKASELKGKLECQLTDGRRTQAELVGVDRKLDLAMVKVEWKDLKPVTWGDENEAAIGSWLVTAGLEKDPISIGVVSAATRAIPRANGALGVVLEDVPNGGGVKQVMPKSAAERAGLKAGDVVIRVGDKAIENWNQLREEIFSYEPGQELQLTVRRGMETLTLEVTLGSFQQLLQGERAEFQNSLGGPLSQRRAGFPRVLQHDTVLKPQDCGGPVLSIEGKALGINIARAGRVETYALAASIIQPLIAEFKSGKFAPAPAENKPAVTEAAGK